MERKGCRALIAVAIMVMVSLTVMLSTIPLDSDGVASSSTHLRVDPVWVTSNTGTIYEKSTGDAVVEIMVETTQKTNGNLQLVVYMRNASGYNSYYIQEKHHNEPDNSNSDSFFYQAMSLNYFTGSNWKQFSGISTYSNAGVFYADFYVCEDTTSYTSLSETTILTLEMRMTATMMYDYTTEIAYDLNGGTGGPSEPTTHTVSSESQLSTVSMGISNATDMSRTDYIFQGWATSKDSTTVFQPGDNISVPTGQTTTLYAIWKEDTVNVTLMDGEEVYRIIAVPRGDIPVLPSDLTKADNTFVGWFEDAGAIVQWDTSKAVSADITLYAGWVPDLRFTTDPVADCKVTELGSGTYMFDATVSKDYSISAASVEWKVYKDDMLQYEATGPYMTCQFTDYGTYSVELKITNSNGVSSTYNEEIVLKEPSNGINAKSIIAIAIVAILVLIVIARMFI